MSFELEEHERQHPLWAKLMRHVDARIAALRIENDKQLDELATAQLRGRIAALLEIRRLDTSGRPTHFIG
jgi:predicted secreted Zn-dependent protease